MKERKNVRKTALFFDIISGGVFVRRSNNPGSVLFCVIKNAVKKYGAVCFADCHFVEQGKPRIISGGK